MSPVEELVENVKARLPLGAAAGPLLQGLVALLFSEPSGIKGFVDKLTAAGFGAQASSWIGKADAPPLSPQGAMQAFGASAIAKLASKAGVDPGIVTAALAYATPKLIGLLTAGGSIPTTPPAAIAAFLGGAAPSSTPSPSPSPTPRPATAPRPAEAAAPPRAPAPAAAGGAMRRWLLPAILALLALAILSHFMGEREPAPMPAPAAEHN